MTSKSNITRLMIRYDFISINVHIFLRKNYNNDQIVVGMTTFRRTAYMWQQRGNCSKHDHRNIGESN